MTTLGTTISNDAIPYYEYVELHQLAIPETVVATLNGEPMLTGWVFEGAINTFVFREDSIPIAYDEFSISYYPQTECEE